MGFGIGYGKVILFSEHFVVYGIPSIVSAIGLRTTANVERKGSGLVIEDLRPETPGYKEQKHEQQKKSLELILSAMGIEPGTGLKITLSGDLIAASGIGASAASCVAIARALNDEFRLGLSDERINEIAYEGEKGYHGLHPSGVDNTAATYGGLIWYRKLQTGPLIERLRLKEPVEIVMGDTGIVSDTESVVSAVRARKNAEPARYEELFMAADKLVHEVRRALNAYDLKQVGAYMDENQRLLRELGVSCKELEFLVELAREHGAYGAKLTGTGLGGYMVALTPGRELQDRVASAIEKEGFQVLRTSIG